MDFCTTCGTAQEPGAKFCTHCGTKASGGESAGSGAAVQSAPDVAPAVTAPAATPASVASRQPYPEPTFYPERTGQSSGLGKALAIVAVVVIVGCSIAYYFLAPRKAHAPAPIIDGRQVSDVTAVQSYGLEKYPGARPVVANSSETEQVIAAFETNDSPQQVVGYYRVRFPVAQVTVDPTHSTLNALMSGKEVLVTADALVHGSRVRISYTKPLLPQ